MALPRLLKDLANIVKLPDMPNRKNGGTLDADEFKAEFDKAGLDIQNYINNELLPQIESDIDAAALGIGTAGSIDGSKLADGSLPGSKLADKTIGGAKIADNGIINSNIADNAIGRRNIADSAIGSSEIADEGVMAKHIAAGAVGNRQLGTAAVTNEKISPGAINERTLADNSVTGAKIAGGAVSSAYIGVLQASEWADNKQSVSISGLPSDKPFLFDLDTSGTDDVADLETMNDEWCPLKASIADGILSVVFADTPKGNIPFKIVVFNK